MAVRVAVHQPAPDSTQAVWLDSAPNLSSTNSTQAHCVDAEHQPTDLAVEVVADRGCPHPLADGASPASAQDLDEQHPRIQHRHHEAQEDGGEKPVEAAAGAKQERHPGDQQRQDRDLGHHDPASEDAR